MTKLFLAAGVAALALAAPAAAERGGKGGGQRGQAAKVDRGGGGAAARAERRGGGGQMRAERRGGGHMRAERRGGGQMRAERRGGEAREMRVAQRSAKRIDRQEGRRVRGDRIDRQQMRTANRFDRDELRAQRLQDRFERREQRMADRMERREARLDGAFFAPSFNNNVVRASWLNGCPPGLTRVDGSCMPFGQYKKMMTGRLLPAAYSNSLMPLALRDLYRDDDDYYYRYGNGYAYRVDRDTNLVAALLPLLGGGYSVGQMFPSSYMNSYVPDYYRAFYPDTNDDYYRYANGYIYEIDAGSGMIEDIVPAYGYGYGVGDLMPSSYSYYNVPSQYRSLYYDTDDHYYRYAPGAIYQVDRQSSLITAIASLLTPGFGVGQSLPMGYDAYNVPYQYRANYYDTPTSWYRYNNGYIYQVDPTTRLITAVIDAIV